MRMSSKAIFLCSVSALAIGAVLPVIAQAADLPTKAVYKAPPAPLVNPWTFWLEGGAERVSGGDSNIPGLTLPFAAAKKTWGWDGAAALDYRFDSMWHASVGFRYGAIGSRTTTSSQNITLGIAPTTGVAVSPNSAARKETNWVADFMVGRDLGIGAGPSQVKFGLRVAQINGKTEGSGAAAGFGSIVNYAYSQTNKWTGYGPRLALEGNIQLTGPWSLDYMAGVAGLFGSESANQTVTVTGTCIAGCPAAATSSGNSAVFNADAMLGLAYAITPSSKLALNYRVDYYANAMRTFNSAGAASNTNRTYSGPNLRWTTRF